MIVITATGEMVTPMVVFSYARKPPKDVIESVPSTWIIGILYYISRTE